MYDIYARPLDCDFDIFLGYIYLDDVDEVVKVAIKKLYSPNPNDIIFNRSIAQIHSDSRYFKIIIKDTYNDSEEIYSCIYDAQENKILEEENKDDN